MVDHYSTSISLRNLLFHLADIGLYIRPPEWHAKEQMNHHHSLYIFSSGIGNLQIDHKPYHLSLDSKCYLAPPGTVVQISNAAAVPLHYYHLTFTAVRVGATAHATFTDNIIPGQNEFALQHFSRFISLAEELHSNKHAISDIEFFRQHLRFQELMGLFFEHNLYSGQSFILAQSVENTIQYIQNNFMHKISVKQLAELANVPQWQYTPIFQKLTGKKPLDYLNELRINHSKEWLVRSDEPLRKIARRVGFEDEFYFNRRFRQTTNLTPRQYANSMRQNKRVKDWTGHEVVIPEQPKRVVFHSEVFGDLLALGFKAVGCGYSFIARSLFEDGVISMEDVGFPINCEKLIAIKPDLIIFSNADENQYQKISQIAPTVTFNSFAPLDQRLLTLGEWLDRKQVAEQWLEDYHAKANTVWEQLSSVIKSGKTASVFIFDHGKRLFVMGASGFSSALYHPLGFQPVDKIQEVLDVGDGFKEITIASLPEYAGERIFMQLPEDPVSREAALDLMNDPLWQLLPAVKNGYVYLLEANEWNYGDALMRQKVLDMLPDLLLSSSTTNQLAFSASQ